MSEDTTGGGSMIIDDVHVIGMNGGTPQQEPVMQAGPNDSEEPKAKEGDLSKDETQPEKGDDLEKYRKKATDSHKQVIELIEDKFKLLENDRLTDEELRTWFLDHPEFSDTANRSKRMKDKYRSLMERSPEVRRGEKTLPKVDESDEEVKTPSGDRPLTATELMKLLDEREDRLLERSMVKERDSKLIDYAAQHNIVDDEYNKLKANADALFAVNKDWTYEQAVEKAHLTISESKGKPMVTASADAIRSQVAQKEEEVDLTKPTPLTTWEDFAGIKKK
jgi:hypothetical protein